MHAWDVSTRVMAPRIACAPEAIMSLDKVSRSRPIKKAPIWAWVASPLKMAAKAWSSKAGDGASPSRKSAKAGLIASLTIG
jgi:hypothetical protein